MMSYETAYGLGRRQADDERDRGFAITDTLKLRAVYAPLKAAGSKYWWANGWWGDQQNTPQCVAFAWVHYLEDGPITWAPKRPGTPSPFKTNDIYHEAQKVDEWPGENYGGTSVRAGAKILKGMGVITEYRWAFTAQQVIDALLNLGPVVLGCNWYRGMFTPDPDGFMSLTGGVAGGHAFVLNGVNVRRQFVRLKNSWGRGWGKKGYAYIDFMQLEKLINEQGEACIAIEVKT